MLDQFNTSFRSLLEMPVISRIRRNHGLEHATLHILSQRFPNQPMAGHSTRNGFRLIGNVPTEVVADVVQEALHRLQAGEARLAVHPNCGTNFVTAGSLAGLAGATAMLGSGKRRGDKLERLPLAMVLATLALLIAYPLGLQLQQHITTSADPGTLRVVEISKTFRGQMTIHRITTQD